MENNANFLQTTLIPDEKNLFLISSKEVDQWFLMDSPWPVLSIVAFYLLFVTKLGPDLMKNRTSFNIKPIILIYDLYQTIFNAYLVSLVFTTEGAISYIYNHGCHPINRAINPLNSPFVNASWLYFFSKVMDLLDTVFFILRKKQSNVTFLHVYHHVNMVLFPWLQLKYIKGEQVVIIGIINSLVHVVMYGYYFLAALGPEMQKYLWWKKYITRMQMIQFIIVIVYMVGLLVKKCQISHSLSVFVIIQGIIFFTLFANFYVKSYRTQRKSKTVDTRKKNFTLCGPHNKKQE